MMRSGVLLAFAAVFLQIAVFLQPLLPAHYQVAPVCETITQALLNSSFDHQHQHSNLHQSHAQTEHNHHDANHQCQYCTVYGNLVLPPELDIKEVFDRIQIRLIAFHKAFTHVWFVLQQLFLMPQGRAPPVFA